MKKSKKQQKGKPTAKGTKTEFTLSAPQAQSVFLSGDFNQWDTSSHRLTKGENGLWEISLNLEPGRYQYRFWVDGEWQNDPGSPECVPNPFGTMNCLKLVE